MSVKHKKKLKEIYINYADNIDSTRVKHIISIITQLIGNEKPDRIIFLISSRGGEVDAGISLYNFLKALPVQVYMHNVGSIDSIANVVFCAGEKRYAAPHSTFLFHGVQTRVNGPSMLSLPQLEEIRDRVIKNHDTIAGIIGENSKMKESEIKKLFAQGETKDVDFALKRNFINEVKLPQIPKGALFISININN